MSRNAPDVSLIGLTGLPEIRAGDDLAVMIVESVRSLDLEFRIGDVLVVTQKAVSKAEGRVLSLGDVAPSSHASSWAVLLGKDPRLVELILREARRIVRMDRGILIAETRHGFVCANAGVDRSNLPDEGTAALLPLDPDGSAKTIRERILSLCEVEVAVVISDTFGRPWRVGLSNVAIGVSGMLPIKEYGDVDDDFGRRLQATTIAVADELAAAAELIMGKTERIPAVLIRGYRYPGGAGQASMLLRPAEQDLFR